MRVQEEYRVAELRPVTETEAGAEQPVPCCLLILYNQISVYLHQSVAHNNCYSEIHITFLLRVPIATDAIFPHTADGIIPAALREHSA